MDQADRVTLRRHTPGNVHFVTVHIEDVGGIRTQFHHVIDIVLTFLQATGLAAPEIVDGITTGRGEN